MNMLTKIGAHSMRFDWLLGGAIIFLFVMGLLTLFGSTASHDEFYKQLLFGIVAAGMLFGTSLLDYRLFRDHRPLLIALYILGVGLLAGLLLFGSPIRGVAGWYSLGPITVQPVEIFKIILLLVFAKYFSSRHIELYRLRHLFISGLYVIFPVLLVMAQPDLGSAVVLLVAWIGIVIMSGIAVRQFLLIVLAGIIAASLLWSYGLQPYQRERIVHFTSPETDPLGGSYQTRQALIALGSGGLFGKGLGEGTQTRLGFLPEFETDFIFSAIGEEWGFVGVLLVLSAWALIFWRLYVIWLDASNNFARLFVGGMMIVLATHVMLNISANLGLLPVTGLSLPFVSAGGSNLLSMAIGMGLVFSIRVRSTLPREFIGERVEEVELSS